MELSQCMSLPSRVIAALLQHEPDARRTFLSCFFPLVYWGLKGSSIERILCMEALRPCDAIDAITSSRVRFFFGSSRFNSFWSFICF